jgi:molybdenum cofactor cytidylyltransferase
MSPQQPIVGILLAAGAGTRFGGAKLVHPLDDGVAIAAHAARNLFAADLPVVVAVVRPGDFPLADILEQEGCHVMPCVESARGMGHTLAHGIQGTRDVAGWIVALADMPRIQPETIKQVARAVAAGATIAAPVYNGERGHPVGFSAQLRDELLRLSGDSGARAVLERHRHDVQLIACDDPGVLVDIDRKSDLDRPA